MACFGSRTRTGVGRIEKCSGEFMTLVSPSSPISIGASDVTSNVGVAHDESPVALRMAGCEGGQECCGAASTAQHQRHDAELVSVHPRPASPATERRAVGVVGDLDDVGASMLGAVGAREPQVERFALRTQHLRQGARVVSTFASRYAAERTMAAYRPSETLFTNT